MKTLSRKTIEGSPWWLSGRIICLPTQEVGVQSLVREIHWRRKWQPTLVPLPGKSYGHRSLAGYGLWRCRVRLTQLNNQRLGLHASTAGQVGLIPGQGIKIPHATAQQKKKKRKEERQLQSLAQPKRKLSIVESSREKGLSHQTNRICISYNKCTASTL